MTKYMITLHQVQHEIAMYIEELKLYGEVVSYSERYPQYIWLESLWDKDILECIMGIKEVREPLYRHVGGESVVSLKEILGERGLR